MGSMYTTAKAAITNGLPFPAAKARPLQRAPRAAVVDLASRSWKFPPTLVMSVIHAWGLVQSSPSHRAYLGCIINQAITTVHQISYWFHQ